MKNKKLLFLSLAICFMFSMGLFFSGCKNEESASEVSIEIVAENKTYDGIELSVSATSNNEADVTLEYKLASADDSDYSQEIPVHAGTYVVRATTQAQEGYKSGLATKQVLIAPKAVNLAWTAPANLTYNKETKVPTVEITEGVVVGDECHVSGTLKDGDNNINAGTFTFVASLDNNDYIISESVEQSYTIVPATVSVLWTAPQNLTYNKQAKVPTVEITEGVIAGDECEISASLNAGDDNINVGTFKYIASLSNSNYKIEVEAEKSYTITKATYSTIRQRYKLQGEQDWRENNYTSNVLQTVIFGVYCDGGEEIEGSVTYNIYQLYSTGNATINGSAITGTKYGLVYIQATIAESANYNIAYSNGMQGINFEALTPVEGEQYSVPTDLTATYGQKLKDIELPECFGWYYDTGSLVGNVGEQQWALVYYPVGDDANIYSAKYNIPVIVTVTKATPEFVAPENLEIPYGTWLAGSTGLPSGYYWSGSNDAGEIGEHTLTGSYNPDINNYNTVYGDITYTVVKANPTYTIPTGLTATYGQTLNDVALPAGFAWAYDYLTSVAVGSPGENHFNVNYTPDDTTHYNIVENIDVVITVSKAENKIFVQQNSITFGTEVNATSLGIDVLHGQNTAVIEYKVSGADDNTYSTTAPTEIGNYVVRITVVEDAYFLGAVKIVDFSIIAE